MANNYDVLPDRIRAKFTVGEGCWIWTGARVPRGYGQVLFDGRVQPAHRVLYQVLVGPIPEGMQLDHLCRVRECVNPAHLEPVTCRENVMRGEGLAAENAAKTHCPQGHEYDETNTLVIPSRPTARYCRACARRRHREWKARRG